MTTPHHKKSSDLLNVLRPAYVSLSTVTHRTRGLLEATLTTPDGSCRMSSTHTPCSNRSDGTCITQLSHNSSLASGDIATVHAALSWLCGTRCATIPRMFSHSCSLSSVYSVSEIAHRVANRWVWDVCFGHSSNSLRLWQLRQRYPIQFIAWRNCCNSPIFAASAPPPISARSRDMVHPVSGINVSAHEFLRGRKPLCGRPQTNHAPVVLPTLASNG